MKKNKVILSFDPLGVRDGQHHSAYSKEFSSVADEFLQLCRSYLRAVGVCVTR
jgi:hypothetical protein